MIHKVIKAALISALICIQCLSASALDTIKVSNSKQAVTLFGSGEFYMDETRKLSLSSIQQVEFSSEQQFIKPPRPVHLNYVYWHKYSVQNESDSLYSTIFSTGHFSNQTLYIFHGDKLIKETHFGTKIKKTEWPVQLSQRAVDLTIPPKTTYTLVLKKVWPRNSTTIHEATFSDPEHFNLRIKNFFYSIKGHYYFRIFFIGILGFLFLFTLFQYIQHKDLAYIYYSGYLLVMTIYFMERHESNAYFNFIFSHHSWLFNSNGGGEPSYYGQLSFIFYLLFTIEFLDIKSKYKKLGAYLYSVIGIIVVLYAIHLCFVIFNVTPSTIFNYYYTYRALLNIPLIVALIWIALKIRTKLAVFYVLGSGILTLTMIIPQFTYLIDKNLGGPFFSDNMTWMQIGILFECFLFSTGLGYKSKLAFEERDRIQQELILKSNENNALTLKFNTELEAEVKEKTSELILKKEQLLKTEYEKELMDLEAQLFRSKMNPHFIYNCLNSIKYFSLSKSSEETAQYITDFSSLMRFILEKSKQALIPLKEEIEFIRKYLTIESRRFDSKFIYEVYIDPKLELIRFHIPPMILQPLIENAIVHGILPKYDFGKLDIRFIKQSQQIKIEIQDNGVGRHNESLQQDHKQFDERKSQSTDITSARLANISMNQYIDIDLKITDLKDNNGSSAGTLVSLHLPFIDRHFNTITPSNTDQESHKIQP